MEDEKDNAVIQARVDAKMREDFRTKWESEKFETESEIIRYLVRRYTYGSPEAAV